ncbi:putative Transforming protein RhoA [Blattamonas nauphoetae]|uniref:Transforming protein RhoA n=1 Tax=Blattamonas nauphoetae TaxID=2049346 RepID=A0ABQ9WU83_9EUKA|nr:putative Transforming protein RhoA [Blattamonas nauphoetae]
MLLFSVINEESFKRIETKWIPEITPYLNDCPVVLVGTHSDARANPPDGATLVSKEQAEQLVEKLKLFGYVECSTTTKEGLPEVFEAAGRAALRKALSGDASAGGDGDKEKTESDREKLQQKIAHQNQLISQLKTQLRQQNEKISGLTTRTEREKKTNEEERTNPKLQPKTQINSAQSTNVIEAKVVCAGGPDTGQSYILRYYTYTFAYFYETSIEVDGKKVNLTLWDTAGSRDYDQVRHLYHQDTDVFMLFFSVISEESFKRIETFFHPDISEYLNNAHAVLVGTHSDARASPPDGVTLVSKEQVYPLITHNPSLPSLYPLSPSLSPTAPLFYLLSLQAEQLVKKLKLFGYVECSATTKEGLPEVFEAAARAVLRMPLSGDASTGDTNDKGGCGCEIM